MLRQSIGVAVACISIASSCCATRSGEQSITIAGLRQALQQIQNENSTCNENTFRKQSLPQEIEEDQVAICYSIVLHDYAQFLRQPNSAMSMIDPDYDSALPADAIRQILVNIATVIHNDKSNFTVDAYAYRLGFKDITDLLGALPSVPAAVVDVIENGTDAISVITQSSSRELALDSAAFKAYVALCNYAHSKQLSFEQEITSEQDL